MSMDEILQFSTLIGDIYDAALAPALWAGALAKAAAFVGGVSATIFIKDASRKTGGVIYDDGGIAEHYRRIYFERYIKLDPATTAHYFMELGEPLATADLIPYDEFVESRFFKEWAQPQNLVDFVAAAIEKSATSAAFFGVFRRAQDGLVDDATRGRMRMITPHVRRAVLVGKVIDLKTADASALAETLEGLSAGLFLVDAEGRIVHANAAGHLVLEADDYLRTNAGRLNAADADTNRSLSEIVAGAANGDIALGTKGISLPLRSRSGERYVLHALPLRAGARMTATHTAVVALFVEKASISGRSPPEVIAAAYKLTPTELRVLLAVVEVGGAPEVAEALGVAPETVKTHLGRLYAKTGARRQADLVKLVAGIRESHLALIQTSLCNGVPALRCVMRGHACDRCQRQCRQAIRAGFTRIRALTLQCRFFCAAAPAPLVENGGHEQRDDQRNP